MKLKLPGWKLAAKAGSALVATALTSVFVTGCLDRDVSQQTPRTTNIFVDQITQSKVDKIDILLVIDNSISMADKQEILALAVPQLALRLVDPICVDADGNPGGGTVSSGCADGLQPEFDPISDIHIGVISSSLGGNGGEFCNPLFASPDTGFDPTKDDRGELIGSAGQGRPAGGEPVCAGNASASCAPRNAVAPSMVTDGTNNLGFLAWDPMGVTGLQNASTTVTDLVDSSDPENPSGKLVDLVRSAGEQGCGFEAPLESWYRFLVDPDPPLGIVFSNGVSTRLINQDGTPAVNSLVLTQRDAFMRPDSLLTVVMLADENDCSVIGDGLGWYVGAGPNTLGQTHLPRSTAICETDPNNECCTTCIDQSLGSRCPDQVAGCFEADGQTPRFYTTLEDNQNLRCWNQKQRFGLDLLYGPERYTAGLRDATVQGFQKNPDGTYAVDGNGQLSIGSVRNPIYTPKPDAEGRLVSARNPDLVFFAGIVGVPWQDISTPESLTDPGTLTYLTAEELNKPAAYLASNPDLANRSVWDVILGNPAIFPGDEAGAPIDPLMIESVDERVGRGAGINPPTAAALAPSTAGSLANPVNGHERSIPTRKDLQYACIFPLLQQRDCATLETTKGCDCRALGEPPDFEQNPLCFDDGTGAYGTTQYRAKAYPGTRMLEALRDYGDNSILASICPKVVNDVSSAAFGYTPAVAAIINRLKDALQGTCLPRPLDTNDDGTPKCEVIEANLQGLDCAVAGKQPLSEADAKVRESVLAQLEERGQCGDLNGDGGIGADETDCAAFQLCRLNPAGSGADGTGAVTECNSAADGGYCDCTLSPTTGADTRGYCYVDATVDPAIGNPAIVETCDETEKRLLRFVPSDFVTNNARVFIACQGAPL